MSLKRILKLLAAFFTGQGVAIVTQLLVPPFFLHRYAHGVEVYGEWIALSAAVSYLNTLNYGIQSYATNQMTIHYNRGEKDEARAVQASALRLLLVAVILPALVGVSLLFLPIARWLNLRYVTSFAASLTLLFLILQLVTNWCFVLVANCYMVIGKAHRGTYWASAQRLTAALALAAFLWNRASFPILALSQWLSVACFIVLLAIDMRITAPFLFPRWRSGSWRLARSMMKPTGWFMVLSVSGFLSWQGPVLVLQKILGPASVAVFALSRMIFSMSRMVLIALTVSISQEITHLIGQQNWARLRRLYDLSEKVILLLVPTVTIGVLLISPLLFSVWLHKRNLYDPAICFIMAAISAVMGIKEHKVQFQWSSNQHTSLSKLTIVSYALMLALAAALLKPFGIVAFLGVWLATEIVQVIYILRLNIRLFPPEAGITVIPVVRLAVVTAIALAIAAWPSWHDVSWPLPRVAGVAVAVSLLLATTSYFVFDLREVSRVLQSKFRQRAVPAA